MTISETIYKHLSAKTDEIGKDVSEMERLGTEINSGKYSQQEINRLSNERMELRMTISRKKDEAIHEAEQKIARYREESAAENRLDPADLTDDVKLLQPGIILNPADIQGMLERNKGNRTMLQVILRYANEHKIDTGATVYVGGEEEETIARNLETVIAHYKYWIDKPDGKTMLDKFMKD